MSLVYSTLQSAGWMLESTKSDTVESISQVKNYLGFMIDTLAMKIFYDSAKLDDLAAWIFPLLDLDSLPIKKLLAKILGKIVSLIPSFGPLAQVCTRSG
jgi:hypothetical protein